MEVCHLCQKLRPPTARESPALLPITHPKVKHHRSISDLQASSISCSLCRLMLSRFDLSLADGLPSWAKDYLSRASIFVVHDHHDKLNGVTILSPRLCSTGPEEWDLHPPSPLEFSGWSSDGVGSGYNIYSTDWKYYLLSHLAIVDDGNEQYIGRALWDVERSQNLFDRLSFARLELQNCLSNHKDCREVSSSSPEDRPPLPTRVIDVGYGPESDNAKVRLIRSNGSKAHYAALSYCWGGGKTEESTIQELKEGIQPFKLAKTYEDAISITRSLGIRYLWIDALCIMQSDPAEVEAEVASMASIYRNTQVSISASASTDFHGGCVQPLEPPVTVTFSVSDSPSSQHAMKQKAYVRSTPLYGKNVLRSHLTTRGWTLQEELIPLRTLYCGHDQMYWRCRERTITEDGVINNTKFCIDAFFHYGDHYGDYEIFSREHYSTALKGVTHRLRESPWGSRGGKRNNSYLNMWLLVINDFTSRTLRYPEDRLRAVVGLISNKTDNDTDNLAGLWHEDLKFGLWWRAHPSSRDLNLPAVGIPSWSWISFNGRVEYEDNRSLTHSRVRVWQFFDVVDAAMKWSGEALTSQLEEATLELNAFLQPLSVEVRQPGHAVHITRASGIDDANFRAIVSSCTGESVRFCGRSRWDPESTGDAELDRMLDGDTSVIYAMHLSSYCGDKWNLNHSPWRPQDVTFLLVQPTGRMKDEYRRIGLGKVSPKHGLFEGVSKRRITLV